MSGGAWVFDLAVAGFLLWLAVTGIRNRKLELQLRKGSFVSSQTSPTITLHGMYALTTGIACLIGATFALVALAIDLFMQNNTEVVWVSQIALIAALGLSIAVFVFCLIIQSAVSYGQRLSHPKDTGD